MDEKFREELGRMHTNKRLAYAICAGISKIDSMSRKRVEQIMEALDCSELNHSGWIKSNLPPTDLFGGVRTQTKAVIDELESRGLIHEKKGILYMQNYTFSS